MDKKTEDMLKAVLASLKPGVTVVNAAIALATVLRDQGKPVLFNMDRYAELFGVCHEVVVVDPGSVLAQLIGVGHEAVVVDPESSLAQLVADHGEQGTIKVDPARKVAATNRNIQNKVDLQALTNAQHAWDKMIREFTGSLSDAFSLNEVYDVIPATLLEIGHSRIYPGMEDASCYAVVALPDPKNFLRLDL